MLVFLDTCCLIYAIENRQELGDLVRTAILNLPEGSQLATTELVRFECIVRPLKQQQAAVLNEFEDVFADCVFLQLGRREFDVAAGLRAKHGLDSLDAIHLAVAINGGCTEFWTNDRRIAAAAKASSIEVREF